MTDRQLHPANRRARWVREDGSTRARTFPHSWDFITRSPDNIVLQTVFHDPCDPSYCFQAHFFTQRFGRLHQEASGQYENLTAPTIERTHAHLHTSRRFHTSAEDSCIRSKRETGRRKKKNSDKSRKKMWQATSRSHNCRLQETLKVFLEGATWSPEKAFLFRCLQSDQLFQQSSFYWRIDRWQLTTSTRRIETLPRSSSYRHTQSRK